MGFKCMNRKCGAYIPSGTQMFWKWKDKTKMCKQHVCQSCWEKARSLKVPAFKL